MEGRKINHHNIFLVVFIGAAFMLLSGSAVYFWQKAYSNEEKNQIIDSNNSNSYIELMDLKKKLDKARSSNNADGQENGDDQATSSESFKYASLNYNLTLPAGWSGYSVKENIFEWEYSGSSKSVQLGFGEDPILVIYQIDKEQWALINKKEETRPVYLGENDSYIFAYSSYAEDDKPQYSSRVSEIPAIIQSFKIN